MNPQRPKSPLSPQLKIEPASKWADNTLSALDSADHVSRTTAIPPGPDLPGPDLPGAYPYTPSTLEPGPSFEEVRDTAKEYLQAAGQYVPSQEDLKKVAQNAGSTIRGYIPNGVAAYLGPSQLRQEADTASPIDESETTPTAGDGFVLLNRGVRKANDQTQGDHDVQHDSINNSGTTYGETSGTTDSEPPEMNGQPKFDSTHLNVIHPSSLGNGQASDDASTRTQPGSRALSEQDTEGVATPFSYTGHSIGGTSLIVHGNSEVRTAATYGPHHESNTNLMGDPHAEMNGHPDGIINHGGVKVQLGPGGEGALTAPNSGVAAEPGPGPGITARQMIQQDGPVKESSENANGGAAVEGHEYMKPKRSPHHKEKASEEPSHKQTTSDKKMDNDTVNTAPRTHPLGKEGTQWKGVPLEEGYQAALDRNEDRSLAIGDSQPSTIPNAKPGTIPRKGDSHPTKPLMKDVNSNTATTGHGGASDSSPVAKPKSSGMSPSYPEGNPPRGGEQAPGQPRPASPMTAEENPHVGRATAGPNSKKLREPSNSSSEGEQGRGRRKGNFLNKIKTWSKRLSQERKAKN